jgi:hypothetical protein
MPLERPRRTWKGGIRKEFREIGLECVAEDRDQWRVGFHKRRGISGLAELLKSWSSSLCLWNDGILQHLYGITMQKTSTLIFTAVKASKLIAEWLLASQEGLRPMELVTSECSKQFEHVNSDKRTVMNQMTQYWTVQARKFLKCAMRQYVGEGRENVIVR